ncbi:hypothetical protein BN1723_008289 [Verticillium longisporum]|uniref:F-box domain-containing protein n=1 Tax=Verticillium longisporum TaxID=100787 RepID=A0A0G4NRD5_VERLO
MAMQGTGAIHVTIYLAGGTLVISIVSHLPLYEVPVAQFCRANQPSTQVSRSLVSKRYVMKKTLSDLPDSALYTKQNICDNTLDDAQLETRCPLDNGRHADALMSTHYPAGQLDQLPAELLIQILLQIDIPSLTHFRRVNRRAMGLVDSIPQYAALIKHCPNIIRAILSIQADAFDCGTLYRTLSTYRCSTCKRFGDHLYLVNCRRVCYFCFTQRLEYFPLTIGQASTLFTPNRMQQREAISARQLLQSANPPSVLSLPGWYCTAWGSGGGNLARKRLQLFDRQSVVQSLTL